MHALRNNASMYTIPCMHALRNHANYILHALWNNASFNIEAMYVGASWFLALRLGIRQLYYVGCNFVSSQMQLLLLLLGKARGNDGAVSVLK